MKYSQIKEMQLRLETNMKHNDEAIKMKLALEKQGFVYAVSFYGVVTYKDTRRREYRRIEVFLNNPPEECDVMGIKNFFTTQFPVKYYTMWIYDTNTKNLLLIKSW